MRPTPRLVPAVERAVRLLDLLSQAREPQPLAALARAAGLPKSSAHGLLATLAALGVAERGEDGEFSLGNRVHAWAGAHAEGSDLVGAFGEIAAAIPALAEETVMLAVLDGAEVVYLACRPGTRPLAVNFRVGGRFPAFVTSSGKAMLATLPEARVRALAESAGLRRLTPKSITSPAGLLRQLRGVRAEGVAVDDEETAAGMNCVGAPVFDGRRPEAVAAVAVSLIKASTTARRRAETVAAIRELAERLSRRLGAPAAASAAMAATAAAAPAVSPQRKGSASR
jgi:DNA-binding IclR family transcriptional regulator